jgi:pyruvate kinase
MATLSRNLRLTLDAPKPAFVKTKIVCTIGPKTMSEEALGQLLDAGMDVCRLNFSHGSHEVWDMVISSLHGHPDTLLSTMGK